MIRPFFICGLAACLLFWVFLIFQPAIDKLAEKRKQAKKAKKGQNH